jgi:hypothetical protein
LTAISEMKRLVTAALPAWQVHRVSQALPRNTTVGRCTPQWPPPVKRQTGRDRNGRRLHPRQQEDQVQAAVPEDPPPPAVPEEPQRVCHVDYEPSTSTTGTCGGITVIHASA